MSEFSTARPRREAEPFVRKPRRVPLTLNGLEDRVVPANPITAENLLPGTPASVWNVNGSGDSTIQGFATDISVDQGQTVNFKINDSANKPYHIDIYRIGYYQGNGARLVTTIPNAQVLKQVQPNPLTNTAAGLIDAGNWAVSASWAVPANATSGLYFARVAREDTGGASHIWFVVRDDDGASDLLFQTADTTWQAYNQWGGNSLYLGTAPTPDGRAYKVSYNRPLVLEGIPGGYGDYNSPLHAEYPMIRWLEANGYNVSYSTDIDTDRRGAELLEHKVFLSVGHDEYWSGQQRANVEAARDAGVNLAFFSGNEAYWKVRWENSIDASGTPYRSLVCYKESKEGARTDPLDISQNVWTGTWRDDRFSPPADGGRPENALTGTLYMTDRTSTDLGISMQVPEADGKLRFWRNTSVATLAVGQVATLGQFVVGYETDEDLDNGFRPAGLIAMSSTTFNTAQKVIVPWGTVVGPGTSTHKITLYRAASGALVFGAGTVQWSWGLDGTHNNQATTPNTAMRQATVNLFADMGVQPDSLQAGLVAATASTDHTSPTSAIASPTAGTVLQAGTATTITGTATDGGGGRVGGVEVSVDGGATWHPAVGRGTWSYTWTPAYSGAAVIRTRAADDSGNIETPAAGIAVTVSSSNTLVAAYSFDAGSGTTLADLSGKGNTGTISGAAWTTGGKYGGALSFDGVNDWVTVADASSLDLTGAMTLEAWVYPTAINGWETVLMKEAAGDLAYAIYGDNNGDDIGGPRRPAVWIRQGSNGYSASGTAQLALNQWTHLAATYDGTALRYYVNGVLAGTLARTGALNVSGNPLRMGGNNLWSEWFNGRMDEVRVYNRALVPAEIQTDMNSAVGVPDAAVPTVSVTAPVGGATVSGTVSVTANAADNVGVAGVQFKLDGVNLGAEDTTAPYSVSWNTATAGNGPHTLTAVARDAAGNTTTATAVTVTVDNDLTPPTVSLTAPADSDTVAGTVTVTATAADAVGVTGVQFKLNGVNLGAEVTAAPYVVSWDTTTTGNGIHTLTAVARDAAGNTTTATAVTVTVANADTTAPTVSLTTPTNGATVLGTVSVTATATDAGGMAGVQFLLDGSLLGAEDTAAPYSVSWNTATAANGSHTLTAVARDAAGNTAPATPVNVTVNNDVTPPTVSLTAPADNATVAGTVSVTATATAADAVGVAGVQFKLDGANLGAEDTAAPYSVSWNTVTAGNGSHILTAVARDAAGNTTTATTVTVTVGNDVTPPTVSLTAPAAGATVSGSVAVSANASDNVGVAGVQFKLDGVNLGAEDTAAPYSVSWNTATAANGSHTLTAVARDAAGNATTATAVTVTVNNTTIAGLVAAYGFEEGSGTTAGDSTANGLTGTITGATWVTAGKYGKALAFNGTSNLVTVQDANALDLTTGMTLEAWVYPTATATDWATALLKEQTNGMAYGLYTSDGVNKPPAAYIKVAGSDRKAAGTSVLPLNTWSHLAATYNNATLRVYVNGVQVASKTQSGAIATSTGALKIGGNSVWGEYFTGRIDEVRIYNRALTAAELQTDMTVPIGGGGGAQLADRPATTGAADQPELTTAELTPLLSAAVSLWEAAGLPARAFPDPARIPVRIVDLPGAGLGFTDMRTGDVWIDRDAAGYGWFIDPTPDTAGEFAGRFDLLTVLTHELGHLVGLEDILPDDPAHRPDDLMAQTLPPGVRRMPSVENVAAARAVIDTPERDAAVAGPEVRSDAQPLFAFDPTGITRGVFAPGEVARIEQRPDALTREDARVFDRPRDPSWIDEIPNEYEVPWVDLVGWGSEDPLVPDPGPDIG